MGIGPILTGKIYKQGGYYFVYCALCLNGLTQKAYRRDTFAGEARREFGWHQTSKYGWVCADCYTELKTKNRKAHNGAETTQ